MPARHPVGNRQPELFARSKRPAISLPENHPMVVLTDTVDWTEMEMRAEKIRAKKLKNAAGRPPQLRADAWGADVDGDSEMPYREAEDNSVLRTGALSVWADGDRLDAGLHDDPGFRATSGEDGCRLINEAW